MRAEALIQQTLEQLEQADGRRALRFPEGIDYCSNDYLSLREDSEFLKSVYQGSKDWGLGSGGSRLVRGHDRPIAMLEDKLAEFSNQEAALLFPSGYQANVSFFSSVLSSKAQVFSDALNHASIIDGIRLSSCAKFIWRHNDLAHLRKLLQENAHADCLNLVVVESIYSMRGDMAPLKELLELCKEFDAELVVDEAHATGLFGTNGSGRVEELKLCDDVLATIHTAGKSLATSGAWVATSQIMREFMVNKSRGFIYSTAPADYQVAALSGALDYYQKHRVPLVDSFFESLNRFQDLLGSQLTGAFITGLGGPVTSVVLGENHRVLKAMDALKSKGFDVRAIRPPTVPKGEALLRITHPRARTHAEDTRLVQALKEALS